MNPKDIENPIAEEDFRNQIRKMKTFPEILKEKIDYYGCTEAAYEFAAEEYAKESRLDLLDELKYSCELGNETDTMIYEIIKAKLNIQ